MDKNTLRSVIEKFGSVSDDEVEGLLTKLNCIENTGQYGDLLKSILSENDKSNFLAFIFEATVAFQFESSGLSLEYEVKQDETNGSSIDFLRRMDSGVSIYLEARLLQQEKAIGESIQKQLENYEFYQIAMNGNDDRKSIIRLQSVILSKVQKKDGTPRKFLRVYKDNVNIVIIDVSDLMLGTVDVDDCLLATHGDPYVEEIYRRGIFGLFQEPSDGYPPEIKNLARSFGHIRSTLNGVLFLFKSMNSGMIDYKLEHYLIWNPNLADHSHIDAVCSEIKQAIPIRLE